VHDSCWNLHLVNNNLSKEEGKARTLKLGSTCTYRWFSPLGLRPGTFVTSVTPSFLLCFRTKESGTSWSSTGWLPLQHPGIRDRRPTKCPLYAFQSIPQIACSLWMLHLWSFSRLILWDFDGLSESSGCGTNLHKSGNHVSCSDCLYCYWALILHSWYHHRNRFSCSCAGT
jgi:hypothetical protein